MTVDFNDYFWGEKNNGFDVLYHNMKFGLVASKELSEFFREKSNIEEQNSKLMSKLAHKASTGTLSSTFAPIWTILRTSAEKLSTLHLQMVHKLTELVKDVTKYADELHKKHKSVKEEESQTLECVQAMQASTAAVQKSRDLFASKVLELEKLRKENASQKDIEKLETKLKKMQEEYKVLLEKHNPIKAEFERRMTQTCKRFQDIEELHLRQMKEFLSTYLEMIQNNHDMVGQVHSDFKRQFLDMTVDKLLEQFVLNKYTGLEKPEIPELCYVALSSQTQTQQNPASSSSLSSSAVRLSQPSVSGSGAAFATNSNSVTSLQGGSRSEIVGGGSLGSAGSGSLHNADDGILSGIMTSPRPTSPELSMPTAATATTSAASVTTITATTTTTSTTTTTPSGASTTSVRSNFRNWFSSSSSHQSKGNVSSTSAATSATPTNSATNGTNATTTNATINAANPDAMASTSSGNFGMESFGSSGTGTVITKSNLPNPELLQSLQDNNNEDQRQQQQFSSPTKRSVDKLSASLGESTSPSTTNHHQHHHHQLHEQHQQFSKQAIPPIATTVNSRRTTSLLNIFTSNSQVSGILRSRREKTKAKKSKKKKDGGSADNIQEENGAGANERNTASATNFDSHFESTKSGAKIAGASSLGFGGATTTVGNSDGHATSSGAGGGAITISGNVSTATLHGSSTNANATSGAKTADGGGGGAPMADVDEDGYSVQPAKETAWEERQDNAGSFYSDSDSDSDNDKPERRIHVKIKPLNNGQAPMSASVDELRATVENISLSPTGVFSHSQQLQQSRIPSRQQSPEISNASTPTATVHPYAPLQSPTLSMTNNSRYADLGDIFSELGEVASAPASANLSKSNSRQIPTPTSVSSIAIPRPPSRRSEMVAAASVTSAGVSVVRGRNSPSPMNRADSIGSLEFRTAIGGIGSSRGPSPLTIGISDTIPLAVAFHEIIHAFFRGSEESRCQVKISGDMMLSFPAGIAGLLANNPNPAKLAFRIKNVQNLENLIPNGKLVQIDRSQSTAFNTVIEFNMPALTALLRRQAEHNPNASYFNVDILKYQARSKPGASSCPFQLVCYWKCESTFTALKIDYKYNNHAMAIASPLLNVALSVPVNGSVRNVQSKPHSAWLGESNRLVWNFTDVSQNSPDGGVGTLRARLELNDGPSTPALITTQFNCEGTTLSGIEFELQGSGYRLSLVKRRFVSGKYVCEGDGIRSGSTPTPPTVGSVGSCSPYSAKSN